VPTRAVDSGLKPAVEGGRAIAAGPPWLKLILIAERVQRLERWAAGTKPLRGSIQHHFIFQSEAGVRCEFR